MYTGKTLFTQIMDFLPWSTFHRIVARYGGDHRIRTFRCTEQFRVLAFAQLTYRESLRDIEACMSAQASKLYHMGISGSISRSTLADANESRDWRIYAYFAQRLIAQARRHYADEDLGLDLSNTVYALDSTTIDLCLSVFPWAPFRDTKAAVKVHTLLDLRGAIPSFIHITDGKWHDINMLDLLIPEPGAFYIMDRAYTDFAHLYTLHTAGSFFVTRTKSNLNARRVYPAPSRPVLWHYLRPEHHVERLLQSLSLPRTFAPYPLQRYRERQDADLYYKQHNATSSHNRSTLQKPGQIELFFKWIKQHLRIKRFYGTSENAVKTQIWIAVSVYVLIAIIKKKLNLDASLYTLLQILSVTLFEKMPLQQAVQTIEERSIMIENQNQLNLFTS